MPFGLLYGTVEYELYAKGGLDAQTNPTQSTFQGQSLIPVPFPASPTTFNK